MPLALDPKETFEIVLMSDVDKDPAPCFIYRYLTGRQVRRLESSQASLNKAKGMDEVCDIVYSGVSTGLVGWENMFDSDGKPIPFDLDRLEDVVGVIEAQELAARLLRQTPNLSDKKKLDSPSPSSSEEAAKPVEDNPTAATP